MKRQEAEQNEDSRWELGEESTKPSSLGIRPTHHAHPQLKRQALSFPALSICCMEPDRVEFQQIPTYSKMMRMI